MTPRFSLRTLQHDVILQSLYPSKSSGLKPMFLKKALGQARTDVFISLMFGGRVVTSAGAFLDSDIAIRIFGEIFSHKDFSKTLSGRGWQPLVLNTDLLERSDPVAFATNRWSRDELRFGLFRDFETEDGDLSDTSRLIRRGIVDYLREDCKEHDTLDVMLSGLYTPYVVDAQSLPYDLRTDFGMEDRRSYDSVLEYGTGYRLQCVFDYLKQPGNFRCRLDVANPAALDRFSPSAIIADGTDGLVDSPLKDRLQRGNDEFFRKLGHNRAINKFHIEGRKHYGDDYEILSHWVETYWHSIRHDMYDAALLQLSSNEHCKTLLDLDPNRKLGYDLPIHIDDQFLIKSATIGWSDFDWSALFSIVSDSQWHGALYELRSGEHKDKAIDKIVRLIAGKLTSFDVEHENGRINIASKFVSTAVGAAGLAGVAVGWVEHLVGVGGISAAVAGLTLTPGVRDFSLATKIVTGGYRVGNPLYVGRQLRRAIIPRLAAMTASSTHESGS